MRRYRAFTSWPQIEVERDWLAPENALELGRRIEAFWRSRLPACDVRARIEEESVGKANNSGGKPHHFGWALVRSNLVNGLPPR